MSESRIIPVSKYPQDPSRIMIINGESFIVDKNDKPRFRLDGSSVIPGGRNQCVKKANTTQYRCTRYEVMDAHVCQKHGAGSPFKGRPGMMLRNKTLSKYTKLPPDLQERYERAIKDPEIFSMLNEIALIQGRVEGIINNLPDQQRVAVDLENLVNGVLLVKEGRREGDEDKMSEGLALAVASVDTIAAERGMWQEMTKQFNQLDKMKTREIERRKMMRGYVPVELLELVIQRLGVIVNEFVPDQQTRERIAAELRRDLKKSDK